MTVIYAIVAAILALTAPGERKVPIDGVATPAANTHHAGYGLPRLPSLPRLPNLPRLPKPRWS